eukprot:scaffold55114_cov56-Phaeocystis_antarctica.AAC.6
MFFTVILFKILYAKLVRVAGFSQHGREWIANGMVSTFIAFITYQASLDRAYGARVQSIGSAFPEVAPKRAASGKALKTSISRNI